MVVILFLTGTISQYLAENHEKAFEYDFKLLSGAAGLVYGYTMFIPLALWGTLKWFGSESANLMECWAIYGYANLIWIPVALVSWSNITGLCHILYISRADPNLSRSAQLRFRRSWLRSVLRLSLQELVSLHCRLRIRSAADTAPATQSSRRPMLRLPASF